MKSRYFACAILAFALTSVSMHFRAQTSPSDAYLTAHEWGTFTSIAGKDGRAVEWLPLTGSTDLPSFVEHFGGVQLKGGLLGTVRMETPVLYFYTNRETKVSVHVSFSKGLITEWYPHADRVYPVSAVAPKYTNFPVSDWALYQKHPDGSIDWNSVLLEPRSFADLPREMHENHYYAARQTSSTPLQINTAQGTQTEKFLFYRGVSTFAVPISTQLQTDGKLIARNAIEQEIPAMLLFERRGEKLGFRIARPATSSTTFDPPELNADMNSLEQTVVDILVSQGLYHDEAQAMFETWRDSWFEEGSRLLYIVPRQFVDSILPLTIQPAPSQTVRVFIGRLELVTPATQKVVEQALETHDRQTLVRYGRFLAPIVEMMSANNPSKTAQFQEALNSFYGAPVSQNKLK
jgi:hypothetical protein